jgi:ArsR family transcriptional regulator, arsenate/arsenite/antimonite-responsive transcriptional repressor / arsenate reductase (thioredoxin)
VLRSLEERAKVHAALGEPVRLAIVDELAASDRSPTELSRRFDLAGNLLAHHLDVLERAGLIVRFASSGDRRRRYVRLRHDAVDGLALATPELPASVLFVCTHNSARSQLAAALWRARAGGPAASAGTHPAAAVHPGAVAAAGRAGLGLVDAAPRHLADAPPADVVVTVCDRAHEELAPTADWWHWSVADPAEAGTADAFDAAVAHLDDRIRILLEEAATP